MPLVYAENRFWRYDEAQGIYVELRDGEAAHQVGHYAGCRVGQGTKAQVMRLTGAAMRDIVGVCAARLSFQAPDFFLEPTPAVAFRNGVLLVEEGRIVLRPHSPAHRLRCALPFDYTPVVDAPEWFAFLRDVFPPYVDAEQELAPIDDWRERANLLQEFVGISMFGLATRFAKALVLRGPGSDGKSVLLSVISELFPKGTVQSIAPHRWSRNFVLADLSGVLFNAVSEMPQTDITDSDIFKAVISGDALTADRKYQPSFRFRPVAGHMIACNKLPATRDHSHGYWRRFMVIPMTRQFAEHEQNPRKAEELIARDLPGIAAWAIQGARRVLERGFYTKAPSSEAVLSSWKGDTDQVREFFLECLMRVEPNGAHHGNYLPADAIAARKLYDGYSAWAKLSGHHPISNKHFGQRIREYLTPGRCTETRYYWGRVTIEGARFIFGEQPVSGSADAQSINNI